MDLRPFLYGGAASILAELCTFPIDTTKTRLQLQGQLNNANIKHFKGGKYNGMLHALSVITKQEGVSALYRGLNAAIIRQASYGTIKIGLYQKLKAKMNKNSQEESLKNNIFCAVISGATASAIANPTDVIKVRLQAKSNYDKADSSFLKEFVTTVSKEGLSGLYKAVILTAARAATLVGVLLPAYDFTKHSFIKRGIFPDNVPCQFTSSLIASTVAAAVSCPIEVIRTRLMNQSLITVKPGYVPGSSLVYLHCHSFLVCLKTTIKNERVVALWKGFVPHWYRVGPWNVIFFLSLEQIQKIDRKIFTN